MYIVGIRNLEYLEVCQWIWSRYRWCQKLSLIPGKSILHIHAFWTNLSHHLGTKSFCWGGSNVATLPSLSCSDMYVPRVCLFTCMYNLSEFRSTRDGHEIHQSSFFLSKTLLRFFEGFPCISTCSSNFDSDPTFDLEQLISFSVLSYVYLHVQLTS